MYDSEFVADLKNKFPTAVAVELTSSDSFAVGINAAPELMYALHLKLTAEKERYDALAREHYKAMSWSRTYTSSERKGTSAALVFAIGAATSAAVIGLAYFIIKLKS